MSFEFATATRIVFGVGSRREVVVAASALGGRVLLVTGASGDRGSGLKGAHFSVSGEPSIDVIREGTAYARAEACDVVVAVGGGSAIDAGKAIAAMLTNPGDPLDYLEVIGRGQPFARPSAPFIAVPTTAGTGSEVTRNAVLASPDRGVKASLRSAHMLPRVAVVDPELTVGLPRAITASTGLDALTQLIEPYVSVRANRMTDALCVDGIRGAARSLPRAWSQGDDREAREEMAWASLLGGMALANAGLGAVHGFAAPVGGMFPAPHGAICAAILPHAMAMNVAALRSRAPESVSLHRYGEVARLVTGDAHAAAEDGANWIARLCLELEVQPLRVFGVRESDIDVLAEKAENASSMKGNPIVLEREELREIVRRAI